MKGVDDVARVFSMIPWLEQHPGVNLEDAARRFGVKPARLRHELSELSMIGADPEAIANGGWGYLIDVVEDDDGGITVTASEYVDRPLNLTPDQALSLVLGLRAVQPLVDDATRTHVDSALAKLEALAGDGAQRVAVEVSTGASDVREVLAQATADGCRLRLTYDGANRGRTTTPVVDPAALVMRDGATYLQAWNVGADGWRTYKVSRVAAAEILDESVVDHGPVPTIPEDWFSGVQYETVVLDLLPAGHWVTEYDPVHEVTTIDEQTRRVTMPVVSQQFIVGRLLRLADAARVVEPADAARAAAARAREALDAYALLDSRGR